MTILYQIAVPAGLLAGGAAPRPPPAARVAAHRPRPPRQRRPRRIRDDPYMTSAMFKIPPCGRSGLIPELLTEVPRRVSFVK